MNKLFILLTLVTVTGCLAVTTPQGTFLEPLPFVFFVGPPADVVAPPPVVVENLRPLPPVYYEPDRPLYYYNDYYYHFWDNHWYFAPEKQGPWYHLPHRYYPPPVRREYLPR